MDLEVRGGRTNPPPDVRNGRNPKAPAVPRREPYGSPRESVKREGAILSLCFQPARSPKAWRSLRVSGDPYRGAAHLPKEGPSRAATRCSLRP